MPLETVRGGINKFLPKADFIKRRQAENEAKAKAKKFIAEQMKDADTILDTPGIKAAKEKIKKQKDVRKRQREVH